MIDLRDGKITDLINNQMAYNPETMSIGYAILQEKQRLMALADRTRLMAVVENLEEWVLDYLALELRAPLYEDGFAVEVKRKLIAGALSFYTKLGTPSTINWVTRTIFGGSQLQEWFEYGGEPYHFRMAVTLGEDEFTGEKNSKMRDMINACKNLRSHLDAIRYYLPIVSVENPGRLWFESLLISGRFAPNIQRAERAGLLMRWAALQALAAGAAFLARARGKNPDILRHTGTLIRGRLPPNRQVPAMSALLLALRAAQSYGARGALLARLKGENQQKARLCRLLLGPYTVDVMGLEAARFDGVHHFDGQRSFWYTFKRRPAFQSMSIQARTANLERISGSILLNPKGPAQNRISGVLRGRYRVRDSTRSLPGHSGTAVRAKIKNINTVTACFTADSMWRFDGAYTFGGERRFNAKIERSEL